MASPDQLKPNRPDKAKHAYLASVEAKLRSEYTKHPQRNNIHPKKFMRNVENEIAESSLFKDVQQEVIDLVSSKAEPLSLSPGDLLLSPKQDNYYVYLLLSGLLSVHFDNLDSPEIRVLEKGSVVGELSVIDLSMPSALVVAKTESRVFPVHRDLFYRLVTETHPVAINLLHILTERIKANTSYIVNDRIKIGELFDHANIDQLTGLYNRRWLENALGRTLSYALQSDKSMCILLIDVDHFKKYNDNFGHLAGDRALIALGEVLHYSIRANDFATRYGGEEFLVLLPDTPLKEGLRIAERIRSNLETKTISRPDNNPLPGITVSIGLVSNIPLSTPESLIHAADAALYQAKQQGRNCIRQG